LRDGRAGDAGGAQAGAGSGEEFTTFHGWLSLGARF
jgi:hypothetical protein